jgi:hypothetical protein
MSVPPRLDRPQKDVLEKELQRLCAKALKKHWMLERGRSLMGLDCVRALVGSNASEDDYADALREYLEGAVQRVESRERRIILEVVLGVGEDQWKAKSWRRKSADERREEAGHLFRGDEEDDVKAGTIRKVHEPHAISDLAEIIMADELKARGNDHGASV